MQLLGLGKSRISQIFVLAKYLANAIFWLFISLARFPLCKFWAIYFINTIFWLFFAQKIALMK